MANCGALTQAKAVCSSKPGVVELNCGALTQAKAACSSKPGIVVSNCGTTAPSQGGLQQQVSNCCGELWSIDLSQGVLQQQPKARWWRPPTTKPGLPLPPDLCCRRCFSLYLSAWQVFNPRGQKTNKKNTTPKKQPKTHTNQTYDRICCCGMCETARETRH